MSRYHPLSTDQEYYIPVTHHPGNTMTANINNIEYCNLCRCCGDVCIAVKKHVDGEEDVEWKKSCIVMISVPSKGYQKYCDDHNIERKDVEYYICWDCFRNMANDEMIEELCK